MGQVYLGAVDFAEPAVAARIASAIRFKKIRFFILCGCEIGVVLRGRRYAPRDKATDLIAA
jgi:hypothetical protein